MVDILNINFNRLVSGSMAQIERPSINISLLSQPAECRFDLILKLFLNCLDYFKSFIKTLETTLKELYLALCLVFSSARGET